MRKRPTKSFALLALSGISIGIVVAGVPAPALAQAIPRDVGTQVVITGRVDIPAGQRVETIVILNGPVSMEGAVTGSIVAINGNVTISGTVDDTVVAVNKRVTLLSGARVGGDVISRQTAVIAPDATVGGRIRKLNISAWQVYLFQLFIWFAYAISTMVLGLILLGLAPRTLDAALEASRRATGPSIGWGIGVWFLLPAAAAIIMATVVAFPLGVAVLLALPLIYAFGYVAGAWILGRALVPAPKSRVGAFFAGWGILSVATLIPWFGALVWIVASLFGLGTLTVGILRARRAPALPAPASAAPPPAPPYPPATSPAP